MAIDYLSSLGAGSGIDTQKVVDSIVAAERAPQQSALTRMKEKADTRVSAFGIVKGTLESVRDQFRKLNDVSDLKAFTTQTSNSTLISATASSSMTCSTSAQPSVALAGAARNPIWTHLQFVAACDDTWRAWSVAANSQIGRDVCGQQARHLLPSP